jgi:hypothetical protein
MGAPQRRTTISQEHARIRFLRLIRDFTPGKYLANILVESGVSGPKPARAVLDDLAGNPLERYRKASARRDEEKLDLYRKALVRLQGREELHRYHEMYARLEQEKEVDRYHWGLARLLEGEDIDRYPEAFELLQSAEELDERFLLCLGLEEVEKWPETRELRKAIASWARRWHLDAPWCKRAALETLDEWHRSPWRLNQRHWSLPSSGAYSRPPFRFETDGWSPNSGEPEVAARERMRTDFENRLRAHFQEIRATVEASTYLSATTRHPSRAFEYLVCFQILELSFSRVADVYDVDHERAVPRSIRNLAEVLGLPLRDSPRGTPPRRSQT